jgi:signal transduction histidine kinase
MNFLGLLNPRRISGQITGLVIVSIVAIHVIITTLFFVNRPDEPGSAIDRDHGQLITLVQLLGTTPAAERPQLIAGIARSFPELGIQSVAAGTSIPVQNDTPPPLRNLSRGLGSSYRVRMFDASGDDVGIALPDGSEIAARMLSERGRHPFWGGPGMLTLLFVIVSLTLLGLWAARALAAPLSAFAKAAEGFSLNSAAAPLPERGPEEIRAVAKALNHMRERIAVLVDDRTKMLAAISHDLRTPITRLRLRAEFIEDEGQRSQMLRDLDQMRSMLDSVLSFLRNEYTSEVMTLTDIATTLQLIADQFADIGQIASYHGPSHAMVMARPDDLQRAVTNLVENAVRFGGEARIRLMVAENSLTIDVEDNGPGITDAQKNAVLQPFVRGDIARNMNDATGFGLGLSIARAVAIAHGGEISLNDREPNGLVVRIVLPVPRSGATAA